MLIKRILGVVIILTSILGLAVCVFVIAAGPPALDRVAAGVDDNISSLGGTLETVSQTLRLAQQTSSQVIAGLNTAEISVRNTAIIVNQTRPLVTNANAIVTGDLANSLDQLQAAIPTLASLAGNIDRTLSFLNRVNILGYGLGIDYNPEVPLDQSITAIGATFNGIPAKLRGMSTSMDAADQGMQVSAANLESIGANLHEINASFSQFTGQFDAYLRTTAAVRQRLLAAQVELRDNLQWAKIGLVAVAAWLGLVQLAPLVVGFGLLKRTTGSAFHS